MRISIFLNSDLESNIALNLLLPELGKHAFNLFISQKIGPSKKTLLPLHYLDFLEREFMLTTLFPKLEEQSNPHFLSFNQISRRYTAPITQLSEVTSEKSLQLIKGFEPDLFLSIRFGKIFKDEILNVPPLGIVNLHSAILPTYQGILGTFRAFLDNETEIGSTIHFINENTIDTGDIIHINRSKIVLGKSVLWHIVNLYPAAIKELCRIVGELSTTRKIASTPQPTGGNYYSFPQQADFDNLKRSGVLLFDLIEYAELVSAFYKIEKRWIMDELKRSGSPNQY